MKSWHDKLMDVRYSMSEEQKLKANKTISALRRADRIQLNLDDYQTLFKIAEMIRDYPDNDIPQEVRTANENLEKRKTIRKTIYFMTGWMARGAKWKKEKEVADVAKHAS